MWENVKMNTQNEQKPDKLQAFVQAYGDLVKLHNVDFATYPMFEPDEQGGFKITVKTTPVDLSTQPVKSEFMASE